MNHGSASLHRGSSIKFLLVLLSIARITAWISLPSSSRHNHATAFGRQSTSQIMSTSKEARVDFMAADAAVPSSQDLISIGRSELEEYFSFSLDDWQLEAGGAICSGANVIVCSPTGSGKTVVGEMALLHAFFNRQQKGIYTTPLKALSNQKYSDLCQIFGKENVGLSTGDISINNEAGITVMTTEVYRNKAWRCSTPSDSIMGTDELSDNSVCVLDEFHYMGFPGRGGVWEESIITSPLHTQIVGLSATLANGQALAAWMESVSGRKTILIEVPQQLRPVPLRYLFASKSGLYPLFRDPDAGPGAPKGLLGYRGDGEAPTEDENDSKKTKKKKGDDQSDNEGKLPKGLQVHPALRAAARARMQKVMKTLERRKRKDFPRSGRGREESFELPPRKLSPRQEQREKERLLRNEMRREVPSLPALLMRLKQKDLLPAIFFIFSRAACDEQAASVYQTMKGPTDPNRLLDEEFEQFGVEPDRMVKRKKRKTRQRAQKKGDLLRDGDGRTFRSQNNFVSEEVLSSYLDDSDLAMDDASFDDTSILSPNNWEFYAKAGLLSYDEVKEVATRLEVFNEQNPEIAFDDELAEQFLFGVGSHHAGQLPAHKSFSEILFRRELMKAVFATETLAAGINMPARTTVVCAMAKRGGSGSMNLLDTSNLLQMAGRAGRRGFDSEGTCVLVATPFENTDDAIKILTDPIKPIESQFTPSYSLAVNLVVRGEGRLEVARQLIGKSFAAWEKRRVEEEMANKVEQHGDNVGDILQLSAEEKFMTTLLDTFETLVEKRRAEFNIGKMSYLLDILKSRESMKSASKSYVSALKVLELEEVTLEYLQREASNIDTTAAEQESSELKELWEEDADGMSAQIAEQQKRVLAAMKAVQKNPFSAVATIAEEIISSGSLEGKVLQANLVAAREGREDNPSNYETPLSASELTQFAKSAVVISRKTRKLAKHSPGLDPEGLLLQAEKAQAMGEDNGFDDMLAIVKVLTSYGCLTMETADDKDKEDGSGDPYENAKYTVSPAGMNVGMLGFENALWVLTAVGGAWDVGGASSALDAFSQEWDAFDDDEDTGDSPETDEATLPKAGQEAQQLLDLLVNMSPAEFAGYVSAIISEGARGGGGSGSEIMDQFRELSGTQQRVIQHALESMDRLAEVQKTFAVDSSTRACNLEIAPVRSVTAWADGCSWEECLRISGLPPGDLVRTLSRVLDAVRQLGNLPYEPLRRGAWITGGGQEGKPLASPGIHPDIRDLCREAARAINRYPVKDPLAFETPVQADKKDKSDNEEDNSDDHTEETTDEESLDEENISLDDTEITRYD